MHDTNCTHRMKYLDPSIVTLHMKKNAGITNICHFYSNHFSMRHLLNEAHVHGALFVITDSRSDGHVVRAAESCLWS
jgi:hypothetical protein